MNNNMIFETVLKTNRDYVEAVDRGANKETQENLLTACRIIFQTMILDNGLTTEYKEYCETKRAKEVA